MARILDVFGYHGTTMAAARSILGDGFRPSAKTSDWLGRGVYFWQDAPMRAWEWAERLAVTSGAQVTSPESSTPAVLRATIRLTDCMDLLDIGWNEALIGAYRVLAEPSDALPRQLVTTRFAPEDEVRFLSSAHRLDCAVVNAAVETRQRPGDRFVPFAPPSWKAVRASPLRRSTHERTSRSRSVTPRSSSKGLCWWTGRVTNCGDVPLVVRSWSGAGLPGTS